MSIERNFTNQDFESFWCNNISSFQDGSYTIEYSSDGISKIEREDEEELLPTKTFYETKCVICLERKPDILFCNCGHLCLCKKCDTLNGFSNICPVCKTKNKKKLKIKK